MDAMGRGGKPDTNQLFVKLYTGEFVKTNALVSALRDGQKNVIYNAFLTGKNVRLGNMLGTFGISQLHGQTPGYTTYQLQKIDEEPTKTWTWQEVRDELKKRSELNPNEIYIVNDSTLLSVEEDVVVLIKGNLPRAILKLQELVGQRSNVSWPEHLNRNRIEDALIKISNDYNISELSLQELIELVEGEFTSSSNEINLVWTELY